MKKAKQLTFSDYDSSIKKEELIYKSEVEKALENKKNEHKKQVYEATTKPKKIIEDKQLDLIYDFLEVRDVVKDMKELGIITPFNISKRKRNKMLEYKSEKYITSIVSHSEHGIANHFDFLIFLNIISQYVSNIEKYDNVSKKFKITNTPEAFFILNVNELFKACGKNNPGGKDYKNISKSIDRLAATSIVKTDLKNPNTIPARYNFFGSIEPTKHNAKGYILEVKIDVANWVMEKLSEQNYKSLNTYPRAIFDLKNGLEFAMYRYMKGSSQGYFEHSISLDRLRELTGYERELKFFKQELNKIIEKNEIPEFSISLSDDKLKKQKLLYSLKLNKIEYSIGEFIKKTLKNKEQASISLEKLMKALKCEQDYSIFKLEVEEIIKRKKIPNCQIVLASKIYILNNKEVEVEEMFFKYKM